MLSAARRLVPDPLGTRKTHMISTRNNHSPVVGFIGSGDQGLPMAEAVAEARTLTTLAGGEVAAIQAARPVFETFSARVVHMGPA
jgi:3-hydroxyisobutyrate dehydrogenase-like beta-hydroxyacid dehydrogenase